MMRTLNALLCLLVLVIAACASASRGGLAAERAPDRMAWWNSARFGMFIHWGLYAVPGGVWGDKTSYGEWIRHEAKIPLGEYDKLREKFNPASFDAEKIVLAAKNAGMKYVVITTKHHDGFCLFDSKQTDFTVMSTPFKRDIMKEMSDACRKHGMKMGWYYSIMDWHHPDYLPRRDWEKDRPTEGANFDRYVTYMKAQLKELLTNYGEIGVLWFDGQWEGNWNDERGKDLEAYVRSLQPGIVINSRVGRGGGGHGLESGMLGDYATPEQFIPERDPGFPWETCMTMNEHWGYNAADKNFKTTQDLIRKLADIASKGGNFLLNIGPTAQGEIPPESVDRLAGLGAWMKGNEVSIIGTKGSPFKEPFAWGRCTSVELGRHEGQIVRSRLYLHVFDWPKDGRLVLPGLLNQPEMAYVWRGGKGEPRPVAREGDAVVIDAGPGPVDADDSVVVLDMKGLPDVSNPPVVIAESDIFVDSLEATVTTDQRFVEIRYTLDGSEPKIDSALMNGPVKVTAGGVLSARCFRDGKAVSPVGRKAFKKVEPIAPVKILAKRTGLTYEYFEGTGDYKSVSELEGAKVAKSGECDGFDLSVHRQEKFWGVKYSGFISVPADGVYRFYTRSDDGSTMHVAGRLVVDNDKPHSFAEAGGAIALGKGLHPISVSFFENWGGFDLKVLWSGPGIAKQEIPKDALKRP